MPQKLPPRLPALHQEESPQNQPPHQQAVHSLSVDHRRPLNSLKLLRCFRNFHLEIHFFRGRSNVNQVKRHTTDQSTRF